MSNSATVPRDEATFREVHVVDCDVHPCLLTRKPDDPVIARLSRRSRDYYAQVGLRGPVYPDFYPKVRNKGVRVDTYPPGGGIPGSDPEFLCTQLLDGHGVDFAILISLDYQEQYDDDAFAIELAAALNDVQEQRWLDADARLRASILVPHENPGAAVREIERRAPDKRWAQVAMPAFPRDGAGAQRYWPIYEAAAGFNLPVGYHAGGFFIKHAWPSYYISDHTAIFAQQGPTLMIGLVASGVFEAIPELRVVVTEQGVTWAASVIWSMDRIWERMQMSAPALKRRPSEYVREHVWFTSQPLDEPSEPGQLGRLLEHAELTDRLMFSSDYPHWDFDSPSQALPRALGPDVRRSVLATTACEFYNLPTHIPATT
jgi:predicted TIM-barrel fold metal-dependent hydrolase